MDVDIFVYTDMDILILYNSHFKSRRKTSKPITSHNRFLLSRVSILLKNLFGMSTLGVKGHNKERVSLTAPNMSRVM